MKLKTTLTLTLTAAGFFATSVASAAAVTSGEFTLDFDEGALANTPAKLEYLRWFDGAASANMSEPEMRDGEHRDDPGWEDVNPSPSGPMTYTVNGTGTPAGTGLEGRFPKPSDFTFTDAADPGPTSTGAIGLAGVNIFGNTTSPLPASMGDFTLSHNGSEWVLNSYVSFPAPEAFTFDNVSVTKLDDENFSLSGDVFFGLANAGFSGGPGMSTETDVGDFTFTTLLDTVPVTPAPEPITPPPSPAPTPEPPITLPEAPVAPGTGGGDPVAAVPVPAAVWLFGTGLIGLTGMSRRKKCS